MRMFVRTRSSTRRPTCSSARWPPRSARERFAKHALAARSGRRPKRLAIRAFVLRQPHAPLKPAAPGDALHAARRTSHPGGSAANTFGARSRTSRARTRTRSSLRVPVAFSARSRATASLSGHIARASGHKASSTTAIGLCRLGFACGRRPSAATLPRCSRPNHAAVGRAMFRFDYGSRATCRRSSARAFRKRDARVAEHCDRRNVLHRTRIRLPRVSGRRLSLRRSSLPASMLNGRDRQCSRRTPACNRARRPPDSTSSVPIFTPDFQHAAQLERCRGPSPARATRPAARRPSRPRSSSGPLDAERRDQRARSCSGPFDGRAEAQLATECARQVTRRRAAPASGDRASRRS
jgi:hypothetical protein